MQAVSPLRLSNKDGNLEIINSFHMGADEFPDFSSGNLLDSIDFDEIFVGMHDGSVDHVLPDLEMDSDLLAEFSASAGEESPVSLDNNIISDNKVVLERGDIDSSKEVEREETTRFGGKEGEKSAVSDCSSKKRKKKTSSQRKRNQKSNNDNNNNNDNNQGKRKTKVDWTPELHRRFVQAVEQLGVDKAVPSRILELMGIDCLTRHNVASHLQKYRSHRKHLLAREAEAACLSQKRHMYGVAVGGGGGGGGGKGSRTNLNPWHAPTMGYFPPPPPPPLAPMHHHFRPLHVWGHPTGDRHLAVMPAMWPKHVLPQSLSPSTPLPATWASPPTHPPPTSPHFWHSIHHARFGATAPMAGIPPPPPPSHALYRPQPPPFHLPPGKEEGIDEAIGEVLEKPWLPLPIGLKPPSTDGVVAELLRQGIPTIPPNSTTSSSLL